MTKLSLVAVLAISTAFAGGDIAPVEPVVEAPAVVESSTSISGKASLIYITNDSEINVDAFDNTASASAAAITLDVTHKFLDIFAANFTAIGYTSLGDNIGDGSQDWAGRFIGSDKTGAYFNVANITATYADTTLIAGRQLLGTPMLQGYDWLIAPGSFEAYTLANASIGSLSLVASYIDKWRPNNSGGTFTSLNGDNWTVGATYDDNFDLNLWYYNIDAANYTQVYADAGYIFSGIALEAQYVSTSFDAGFGTDSSAFGARISTTLAGIDLSAAYNRLIDGITGYIGWNNLYVNSWNFSVADQYDGEDLDAFKVSASTTIANITTSASYASFDKGHEIDVILGYEFTESIDLSIVYSNNKANDSTFLGDVNVVEVYANYKF